MTTDLDYADRGPRTGELFPNVRLPDQRGDLVDLHARRGTRPAVVVFYRSSVW